jgi:hypothetical protein
MKFRHKCEFCQQGGHKKMTKSARKKTRRTTPVKGEEKTPKTTKSRKGCLAAGQTKAAQYTDCLLELHKLQGTLLTRLRREI